MKLTITLRQATKFLSRIDTTTGGLDGCHEWLGATNDSGYGVARVGRGGPGSHVYAHRLAWSLANGAETIPAGLVVRHACDNPCCCNPDHLSLGTWEENAADMVRRGRSLGMWGSRVPARVATVLALVAGGAQ